jgi:hypothetical protein
VRSRKGDCRSEVESSGVNGAGTGSLWSCGSFGMMRLVRPRESGVARASCPSDKPTGNSEADKDINVNWKPMSQFLHI